MWCTQYVAHRVALIAMENALKTSILDATVSLFQ
jgi:hypothetical protein